MLRAALYKYSPGQASPEELEATFVGREGLLDQLLRRTAQWCEGAAPEHALLLGPRGSGKTHLLHLFGHRLASAPLASPLRVALFPEESYTVGSADELLVQVWSRLPESGSEQPPRPATVGAAWVLDRLRELHARSSVRVLILLDGFDLLLDQWRESDERELHRLLTTEGHLCLVATTAGQTPAAVADHDRALFQILRPERLRPLEASQADELLRRRAEWAGDAPLLERWPDLAPRIRALADLAGGNPRLLLMLYQSLELGELPTVIEAFRALLDELTPYYKHIVESRAPQQRKLLALAAFHDRGASPSELAAESGLPERQVSALLGPLTKDGLLRRVRRPGARASAYPFVEPLLRMWLQMRASPEGERRVACIIEFFRIWYAGAEFDFQRVFAEQVKRTMELARGGDFHAMQEAMLGLGYLAQAAPSIASTQNLISRLTELLESASSPEIRSESLIILVAALDRALELQPDDRLAFVLRAGALMFLGRHSEGMAGLDRAVELMPDFALAFGLRAAFLLDQGRAAEALFDASRALDMDPDNVSVFGVRGRAHLRLDQDAEALADFSRILKLRPNDLDALEGRAVALLFLGRYAESVAECNHILALDPDHSRAIDCRGTALLQLGRPAEALADFNRLLALRPDDSLVFNSRGLALLGLGRHTEALADFDRSIELDSEMNDALFNRGLALAARSQAEDALPDLELGVRRARAGGMQLSLVSESLAELVVTLAARDDPGLARRGLHVLTEAVRKAPDGGRPEALLVALRTVFRPGHQELCAEALELLSPLCDEPTALEPFRQALIYIEGGRDPYSLEALNPDVRRAVELVVAEFGTSSKPAATG